MALFSQTTEYAIRAMIQLARLPDGKPVLAQELTKTLGIPQFYLAKILHRLARARLLLSTRGRGGGFRLALSPAEIPLVRVVEQFEDLRNTTECILGRPRCSDEEACPMHEFWKDMRSRYVLELESKTLAELAAHEELWMREQPRTPPAAGKPKTRAESKRRPAKQRTLSPARAR